MPDPAQRTDLLVQPESCHQRQQHVSQRRCRQNVREISPGKGVHIGGEKRQQQEDSDCDPGIEYRQNDALQMMKGDVTDLLHPVREHGVTGRCKDGHSGQHQILAKGHVKPVPSA